MTQKILLADDSVTIRKVVELTFADEDFTLVPVGDGAAALEAARGSRPDLVLSDVAMPGMSGYELCRRLKDDPELRGVPFVFLRGTFEAFDEQKARECGADGFIVKPFESQEMIRRVKEFIAAGTAAPAAAPRPPAPQAEAVAPPPAPAPVAIAAAAPAEPAMPRPVAPPVPTPPVAAPPPPGPEPTPAPEPEAVAPPPPLPPPPPPPPVPERLEAVAFEEVVAAEPVAAAPADLFPGEPPGAAPVIEEFEVPVAEAPPGPQAEESATAPAAAAPGAAAAGEVSAESEDLWSEVSLRDRPSAAAEGEPALEEDAFWGAGGPDVFEEGAGAEPATEDVFEEVSTARLETVTLESPVEEPPAAPEEPAATEEPPAAVAEQPQAAAEAPAEAAEAEAAPATVVDAAAIERVVAERLEGAVRAALAPLVGDLARRVVEEVVWEVVPELAEAMIRAEIERVRRETGAG